jgi:MinD-like ATPase involved in chromosome partitioning or flagellar assembly
LVAVLGGLLALAVPGPLPVVAVDMHPTPWGGLADRVGRQNAGTVWDAFRDVATLTTLQDITRWVQRGPTGLLALVGETQGRGRRPPSHTEAAAVTEAVRRQVALTVVDLMPAFITGVWHTLASAAAPVLVARGTVDSVQHTLRLLSHLRDAEFASVADRCVMVVMATSPWTAREVRAAVRQASTAVSTLVPVPYDERLARPEPADPRTLRKPTRNALVELAEAVLSRCADPRLLPSIADERWPQ